MAFRMEQIGRYRITGELGRGAMGVVYRAEDPSIGRTVAIKTIRLAEAASDQERQFLRDRLFREARSAGILSHPGIVTIYDIQESDGVCYVFMEYVDGPTLEKLMSGEKPIHKELLFHILDDAAASLDYAHSRGIVHRDIKPANIMLTSNGAVKITDFGVAKFTSQQATNTGMVLGTPSYMSPEQISDLAVDGRADQFSLAVIAYQLLTGERPFTGNTVPALMFKIVHEEPIPPQRLNSTLGAAVDVVIRRALSKDAKARFPNCEAFTKALHNACAARPNWKPVRQGAIDEQETVAEPAMMVKQAAARPGKPATPPAVPSRVLPPEQVPASRKRSTVFAFLAGFAVVGLMAAGLNMLLFHNDTPQQKPEQAAPSVANNEAKPSPMGPQAGRPEPPPPPVEQTKPPEEERPAQEEKAPEAPPPVKVPEPAAEPAPRKTPAAVRKQEPQPQDAAVRVVTSPPGVKIMFDGQPKLICTSPCEMTLPPGRHTLATIAGGYREQQRIFMMPDESSQVIVMERAIGTVVIHTTPPGATIFIDGRERTERTPAQITLAAGAHKLALEKEGFHRQEQDIDIKDGSVTNINLSWTR
ncbi:MAG: protein kinase [Bryobacterales bacterium]|nr:protein kinase [Bryobacterales bacterium]